MAIFPGLFLLVQGLSIPYDQYDLNPFGFNDVYDYVYDSATNYDLSQFGAGYESATNYDLNSVPLASAYQTVSTSIGVFLLLKLLGKGEHGSVYETRSASGYPLALKMEQPGVGVRTECLTAHSPPNYMTIIHEYRMMTLMQGTRGFPRIFGSSNGMYAMELLGPSLESYRNTKPGGMIPQSELGPMGAQMVTNLEAMHRKGYLMVDIHFGNFLFHNGQVYNVDLAWAAPITGKPVLPSRCRSPGFAPAVETGYPRDDMVRLMYTLVWLATGQLPWASFQTPAESDRLKQSMRSAKICGVNGAWLLPAFRYVRSLPLDSRTVDYNKLRYLLLAR